ncbi:rhodanese-like domain-containing protein [Rhodococcus spelaei]|uniref:Rhodanese-like domain-containing protein n=1 Tax=Rhodococcus spelaei TaxID=2546320 RepID=A0A541BQZ0_9NOCA|nr:rhodanese-like domain-containing protein [Rhodococcus spelaei]TQF74762.1 rhodanese-like domain-containing protein [Rhodococcus spelaei]
MSFGDVPSVPVGEVPDLDESVILLDIREDDEWELGHAPGALHIRMVDVPARLDDIDIDAEVYVICRSGGRSVTVVEYLNGIGFEAVMVSGGMVAWQKSGLPLTAGPGVTAKIY